MPKKRSTFSEENIQKALNAVQTGKVKKKTAAKMFNISRSTLQFRLGNKFKKARPGPQTILFAEEENKIVEWVLESCRKGFPKRKEDILHSVKNFLDICPRVHPFGKENIPGIGWYRSFLKRHKILVHRTPEPVTAASANVSKDNICKWFDEIQSYLEEKHYFEILSDPSRVFNGDETNFLLCPKTKSVLAEVGCKNVYEVDKGAAKSSLTVMFTVSAAGGIVPPMIIYPYKRIPDEIRSSVPSDWAIGRSDNGWMTREVFYEYISKCFYPYLLKTKTLFPIILFVDGHVTHLTYELSQLCKRLQIILVALYPNATRILQPCDVSAFKPLKNAWKKAVLDWRRSHPESQLKREQFAPLLDVAIENGLKADIIINGFRACGIFPWNKEAIDFSKCLGKQFECQEQIAENIGILQPQNSTTYNFVSIVGESKMLELKSTEEHELDAKCENFRILYNLYKNIYLPNLHCETENVNEVDIMAINDFVFATGAGDPPVVNSPDIENTSLTTVEESKSGDPLIGEFLDWPNTPVRKGVRKCEKVPFVLTSSGYMKIKEQKKKEKEEKLLQKEKRMLLLLEKNKNKENKKPVIKKEKTTNNKMSKNVRKKKLPVRNLFSSNPEKFVPLSECQHRENLSITYHKPFDLRDMQQNTTNKETGMEVPSENLESLISELLSDEKDENEDQLKELSCIEKYGDNVMVKGKMCYKCADIISGSEKIGIRCSKCIREYHISCITKLGLSYLPLFTCSSCKEKN